MSLNQRIAVALSVLCVALVGVQFWHVADFTLISPLDEWASYMYLGAEVEAGGPNWELLNFWAKLGFSVLFGGAALWIVLKAKHPQRTQDWAFSVLTLIAGVWIGTVS